MQWQYGEVFLEALAYLVVRTAVLQGAGPRSPEAGEPSFHASCSLLLL